MPSFLSARDRSRHPRRTRRTRGERGTAAVEFAILLVPLTLFLFGTVQYGYYFFAVNSGTTAAQQAARRVAVGDCSDDTLLTTFVQNRLTNTVVSGLTVTRAFKKPDGTAVTAGSQAVGDTVSVTVRFDTFNLRMVPVPGNATVTKVAVARVEDLTSSGSCV